ncbi:Separase [Picochlorum sp. SENEW3]|nr:Separase [Picochlorum sp. SENEW3]WPT17088.1 Separase [Picochlorum sp. SENEW3]
MVSREGRELLLQYSRFKASSAQDATKIEDDSESGVVLDPQVVLKEIGQIVPGHRSSRVTRDDIMLCYKVVKLIEQPSSGVLCSLALYKACCGLEKSVVSELYGSAVIGSLLLAGIGLSKCIDTDIGSVKMYTEEFLGAVEDAVERLSGPEGGVWDQYGMTLFKSMNKLAVGLLTQNEQDLSLDVCKRGILSVAGVCHAALPRGLKAVVGISQHICGDSKRLDLMVRAMDVGICGIREDIDAVNGRGLASSGNDDDVSGCVSMLEQSMSCARRVLVSILDQDNIEAFWSDFEFDRMDVVLRLSSCVELICGTCSGTLHAAVAALAAMSRMLSYEDWDVYNTGGRYICLVKKVLGIDVHSSSSSLSHWTDCKDAVRELYWFAGVVRRRAENLIDGTCDESRIDMVLDMLWGSLASCIVAEKHMNSGAVKASHELAQQARCLMFLAFQSPKHHGIVRQTFIACACLAWNLQMPEYVTQLFALAISHVAMTELKNNDMMDFSSLIEELEIYTKKHKVQGGLVEHAIRDCIATFSQCGSESSTTTFQSQVQQIVAVAKRIFNPGKCADQYVRIMLSCYEYKDVFPDLFSAEEFSCDLKQCLEKTKTKIGKKRIEDIISVIDILQIKEGVGRLLKESAEHQAHIVAMRRKKLTENPALVHAEEISSMESEYIDYMLSTKESWDNTIRIAHEMVHISKRVNTLSSHGCVADQLEALIHLHDPINPDLSGFWEHLFNPYKYGCIEMNHIVGEIRKGSAADSLALFDLHMAGSRFHAMHGEPRVALFHAIEAHRYISLKTVAREGIYGMSNGAGGQWWSLISRHLCAVSWLGFLFATCGMYEEAIQSYKEGLKYACLVGCLMASAYFSMSLAELYYDAGDFSRFNQLKSKSIKIVTACGQRAGPVFICLKAQLESLTGLSYRKSLRFEDAAQKIFQATKSLDEIQTDSWYEQRIRAFCALEELNIMVDEKPSDFVFKHLDSRKELIVSSTSHPFLLGTPFYKLILLQAQLLSQSFFKRREKLGPRLWTAEVSQHGESEGDIRMLWTLHHDASPSPFCQRVIGLLLAPMCASRGYRYTSAALLHSSSNATLQFQQELVGLTKHFQKLLKDPNGVYQVPEKYLNTGGFSHDIRERKGMEHMELVAQQLVYGWLEQLPSLVICGVSVYSSAIYGRMETFKDKIVLHRIRKGQIPIMVEIPSPEVESNHPIQMLHGTKSCGSLQLLRDKFQDILHRSNANMKSISSQSIGSRDQRIWWEERVDLDNSMQNLLQELQSDWIGPWKCLFRDVSFVKEETECVENDEVGLLAALLSLERQSLGRKDFEIISSMITRALGSKSQDGCLDISSGDALAALFRKLDIGKIASDNSVCRKVSFKDEAPKSPELVTVLRSDNLGDISDQFSSFHIKEEENSHKTVPETPGNLQSVGAQSGVATTVKKKKHKSRLAQMHAMATPGPRRALGPHNGSVAGAWKTPRTAAKETTSVTPLMDTVKTAPRLRTSKPNSLESSSSIPVALILDHAVQCLPWESSFSCVQDGVWEFYRLPSLPIFCDTKSRKEAICVDSCYYAINPEGDLKSTQQTFEKWFRELKGWTGKAGSPPNAQELSSALQEKDLFIYCGHGAGEQYIPIPRLRSLESCASSLLMGCSSGRLRWNSDGLYEASGVILAYIIAGCPAVIGNLWDVTDKDIDRYCQEIVTKCISSCSTTSSEDGKGQHMSIGQVTQTSRHACKLPYLIGAAPVCYGIPVHFR